MALLRINEYYFILKKCKVKIYYTKQISFLKDL